jgi:hypothetical protein
MEQRVTRFRGLSENPWFNVMNWVLDEFRSAPQNKRMHAAEGWVFYGFSPKLVKNGYRKKIRYRAWDVRDLQERAGMPRNG